MSARSRIGIGLGICAIVSLLGSNVVFAQEAQLREPLASKDADSLWSKLGLKISGATDVTYTQNFNNPSATYSQGDFNRDGTINALDFNVLATKFGATLSGPSLASQAGHSLAAAVPGDLFGSKRVGIDDPLLV